MSVVPPKTSLFFGTPDFAVPSLKAALKTTRVLAVVTQPDRPRGRGHLVTPCPVKALAVESGIPVFSPPSLRKPSEELTRLKEFLAPPALLDYVIVTAYGNLLPQEFLDLARVGPINVHASLLPRWRGAAPIQRAIEAGDAKTGVCLQKMVMALDAGDVLAERVAVLDGEALLKDEIDCRGGLSAIDLTSKLSKIGGDLLESYLSTQVGGTLVGTSQNPDLVTIAPKISKEEALCDPQSWSPLEMHNKVRAFAAWPQVKIQVAGGEVLKVLSTALARPKDFGAPPILRASGSLGVEPFGVVLGLPIRPGEPIDQVLVLQSLQAPNRPPITASAYFANLLQRLPALARQGSFEILKPFPL